MKKLLYVAMVVVAALAAGAAVEKGDEKLPNVLLLGDSIRLGYGPFVRDQLKGKANVYQPEDNCRYTYYTLRGLFDWRTSVVPDAKAIDVVHWNNGLWDLGQRDGRPDCLTPLDVYTNTLVRIHGELRHYFPNAKIVFATTTPINTKIVCEQHTLGNAVVERYNAAARMALEPRGVLIDDLYGYVVHELPDAYADIVHYTPAGYEKLAAEVARHLPLGAAADVSCPYSNVRRDRHD